MIAALASYVSGMAVMAVAMWLIGPSLGIRGWKDWIAGLALWPVTAIIIVVGSIYALSSYDAPEDGE